MLDSRGRFLCPAAPIDMETVPLVFAPRCFRKPPTVTTYSGIINMNPITPRNKGAVLLASRKTLPLSARLISATSAAKITAQWE